MASQMPADSQRESIAAHRILLVCLGCPSGVFNGPTSYFCIGIIERTSCCAFMLGQHYSHYIFHSHE